MGLKGDKLWVMGQLDSTCSAPPRAAGGSPRRAGGVGGGVGGGDVGGNLGEVGLQPLCSAAGCI
jgi:hypothetical protein